jgi:hypothetical protein
VERALFTRVLQQTHGHQSQASARLGLNRSTLRYKLRELGISKGGFMPVVPVVVVAVSFVLCLLLVWFQAGPSGLSAGRASRPRPGAARTLLADRHRRAAGNKPEAQARGRPTATEGRRPRLGPTGRNRRGLLAVTVPSLALRACLWPRHSGDQRGVSQREVTSPSS